MTRYQPEYDVLVDFGRSGRSTISPVRSAPAPHNVIELADSIDHASAHTSSAAVSSKPST